MVNICLLPVSDAGCSLHWALMYWALMYWALMYRALMHRALMYWQTGASCGGSGRGCFAARETKAAMSLLETHLVAPRAA